MHRRLNSKLHNPNRFNNTSFNKLIGGSVDYFKTTYKKEIPITQSHLANITMLFEEVILKINFIIISVLIIKKLKRVVKGTR